VYSYETCWIAFFNRLRELVHWDADDICPFAGSPFQYTVGKSAEGGTHKVDFGGVGIDKGQVGMKSESLLCILRFSFCTFVYAFLSTNIAYWQRFYARKQNASRVFAIVWASVCPSVCPSVTLVSCIKTVQARTTKFSPWTAPRSLVYCDKISCHWVQGFSSNEGVEEGYPS